MLLSTENIKIFTLLVSIGLGDPFGPMILCFLGNVYSTIFGLLGYCYWRFFLPRQKKKIALKRESLI